MLCIIFGVVAETPRRTGLRFGDDHGVPNEPFKAHTNPKG